MKRSVGILLFSAICWHAACLQITAQQPATHDAELDAASAMIGRALFLRCLCADNNLIYDSSGKVSGNVKHADWTVDGMNVQKVFRKSNGELVLEGVRVAVRFATDRREFDRRPQSDEPLHITVATTGDAVTFSRTLHNIFAQGIDRELQLSMPLSWQHYFDPGLKWPDDELTNSVILSAATATPGITLAAITHREEVGYTLWASRDHVSGSARLHAVVDAQGTARRITIVTPMGYGLDEKAVEAIEKYRFTPATAQGKPVASNVLMDEAFTVVPIAP